MSRRAITFFGPPGAGKGTQTKFLSEFFQAPSLSMGDLLRQEIQTQSPLGKRLESLVDQGEMSPWPLVETVLRKSIHSLNAAFIIFDGIPRHESQIQDMEPLLKELDIQIVRSFFLNVSDEAVINRLSNRHQCSVCGAPCAKTENTGLLSCLFCGNKTMTRRQDDRSEVIQHRLKIYHENVQPLLHYYEKKGILKIIDAQAPLEDIQKILIQDLIDLKWGTPVSWE